MQDVFDKVTWSATSVASPAATVLADDRVVVAWRGNENSEELSVAVVHAQLAPDFADSTLRTTVLSDSSVYSPALAVTGDGRVWMAWTGTNGAQTVNVATLTVAATEIFGHDIADSVTVNGRSFVNGGALEGGGASGPTFSVDPYSAQLSLHVRAGDGQATDSSSNPAGAGWATDVIPAARDAIGPVCAVPWADGFLHAWTAADGRVTIGLPNGEGDTVAYPSVQTSAYPPAAAMFAGQPYVAWTRTDGYLSIGRIDFTGGGDDGIVEVRQLSEISLAGPALVDRPGQIERLGILWTGVDGTGALNAAVVYFL